MQRRHNQTGNALGWNLCFQQAGGKIRLRALCCPLFDITLSLLRESPDCSSLRASNRHRRSIKLILPSLLAFSPWEGYPCWSKCGRRTRPFSGRAFREHRANVGALPIFLRPHVARAQKIIRLHPLPLFPPALAAPQLLSVHPDQPRPQCHPPPFARSSEPPEDSPPAAGAESATRTLNR